MNLTETSIFFRRAAVFCVVFVIGFFMFKFAYGGVGALLLIIHPPPPPPITTIFGKLPPLTVSQLPIENRDAVAYTIDTPTGKFPALPIQANVYKIPHPPATLLSESRARALAKSMGFSNEPTRVSSSDLHWDDPGNSRTLDMNIVTGIFTLKTDPAKLAQDLSVGSTPTSAQAISSALAFFTNKQLLSSDYIQGTQPTLLIQIPSGELHEAPSLSQAQLTRVNLFRQVDKLNVYGPSPKDGLIQIDMSAAGSFEQYPNIKYFAWNLDYDRVGRYTLKSPDTALLELKSGQSGFTYLKLKGSDQFDSYVPLSLSQVSIRNMEVGYFDSQLIQDYLQPIYVFSGIFKTTGGSEGEFIAYVPAIDASWVATP